MEDNAYKSASWGLAHTLSEVVEFLEDYETTINELFKQEKDEATENETEDLLLRKALTPFLKQIINAANEVVVRGVTEPHVLPEMIRCLAEGELILLGKMEIDLDSIKTIPKEKEDTETTPEDGEEEEP